WVSARNHPGFADSPGALSVTPFGGLGFGTQPPRVRGLTRGFIRHPLRGFGFRPATTPGSRTHPGLYSVTPSGGWVSARNHPGFADSPGALSVTPFGGFGFGTQPPRVRGLTRGFIPSPLRGS